MSKSSSDGSPQLNGPLLPNQKVRTTCNACQQAKIRCSHTHPCDRCVSHGFECVYSISQPLGRPAKKKGSRPTQGLQSGRTEGEAAGRPLRRGALGAPKIVTAARLVTARTRQRLPRQRVAPESSPEARGGTDVGTEVTGREGDLIVPGVMETAVEIPGKHKEYPNGQPLLKLDALIYDHFITQKRFHPEISARARKIPARTRPTPTSAQERRNKAWTQTTRS